LSTDLNAYFDVRAIQCTRT